MLRPPRIDGPPGPVGFRRKVAGPASTTPAPYVPGIVPVAPADGAPDLLTQALSRVIQQYRESPKLLAVISGFAYLFQEIANAAVAIPPLDDFDTSSGVNLDVLAAIIGQTRTLAKPVTVSDIFLRALARARVVKNHATGTAPEIIAGLAALLGNDGTHINYFTPGFMFVSVQFERQPTSAEAAAIASDLLPRPAGVDLSVAWFLPAVYFGWDEDLGAGAAGFAEEGDQSVGGAFAEIV